MYKLYANNLQLHSIHFGEDMKASENMEFIVLLCAARTPPFLRLRLTLSRSLGARQSQGSTNNALCFIGCLLYTSDAADE